MIPMIAINGTDIMKQARMTAHDYLLHAVADVNKVCGDGAAKAHPELVAAYMNVAAIDCGATVIAQQLRAGLGEISESIIQAFDDVAKSITGPLSDSVRSDHPLMGDNFDGITSALREIAAAFDILASRIPQA